MNNGALVTFIVLLGSLAFSVVANANAGITYHGRLIKPDGDPVTATNVQFRIQIRTPGAENCLLYEETHLKNLSDSNGMFAIGINDGTALPPGNIEPFTLSRAFQNRGTFTFGLGKCSGASTYAPNSADGRKIVVEFNDGSFVGWEPLPAQTINFVPMAIESTTVGGFGAKNLMRFVDGSGDPIDVLPMTATQHNTLLDLVAGTSGTYLSGTDPLAGANLVDGSVTDAKLATGISGAKILGNILGNAAGFTGSLAGDVTGGQATTSVVRIQGRAVDSAAPSNGQVLKWSTSNNRWEPATDLSGGGGGVTSVSGLDAISVANGTTTPEISVRTGTNLVTGVLRLADDGDSSNPGEAVGAADSRLSDARTPTAHTHPANQISSATGIYLTYAPNGVVCADGQVLKWANARWECGNDTAGGAGGITDLTGDVTASGTGSVAATISADAVTSAKILDGTIATADIANSAVTNAKIVNMSVDKVVSGAGQYFTYKPNDVGCGNDQVLKWNLMAQRWECANDAVGAGGGIGSLGGQTGSSQTFTTGVAGLLPNISSASDVHTLNVPLASTASVTSGTISHTDYLSFAAKVAPTRAINSGTGLTGGGDLSADRTLAVNVGTGANQIPQLDAGGKLLPAVLPSSVATSSTSLVGDVTGTLGATKVEKIQGVSVATAGPAVGQVMMYVGSEWTPSNFGMSHLKTAAGTSQMPAVACSAGQTLAWSSLTDLFTCSNVVVGTSGLSDGSVTTAKILDGTIGSDDLANLAVTDAKIAGVTVNKILSGSGAYFTYAPNNVVCTTGQVLKWNNARWECGTDDGGAGNVTSVTSANTDIAVATTTTTPVLTLNSGTGANQILKLNGSAQLPAVSGVNLTALNATNITSGTLDAARLPTTLTDGLWTAAAGDVTRATGNVGIGTASANSKLTLQGAMTFSQLGADPAGTAAYGSLYVKNDGKLYYRNGTGTIQDLTDTGAGAVAFPLAGSSGAVNAPTYAFSADPSTGLYFLPDPLLAVAVNGQHRAQFDEDGFGVDGKIVAETEHAAAYSPTGVGPVPNMAETGLLSMNTSQTNGSAAYVLMGAANSSNEIQGAYMGAVSNAGSAPSIVIGSGKDNYVERLRIDSSGNLGVGTTSPNSKLTLQGGMSFSQLASDPAGTASYGSLYAKNDGKLYFRNGTGTITDLIPAASTAITSLTGDVTASGPGAAASTIAANAVTSGKILDGTIATADLANLAVTDAKIAGMSVDKISNAASAYFLYAPNNTACTAGQVLKWNSSRWECGTDTTGGAGTVTSVTSANADIGVATTTTTPVLTLNSGTGANQIVKLNASSQLPAVSGVNLTALNATNITSGTLDVNRLPSSVTDGLWTAASGNVARATGNVGIGTATPNSKLDVNGQIRAASASIATGSVNWDLGNAISTSYDCAAPLTFANLRDGGSYTLSVTGTGTTMCTFSTSVTGSDSGTVTYRYKPANGTRQASSHTIYSMVRIGTVVYVSWITGF